MLRVCAIRRCGCWGANATGGLTARHSAATLGAAAGGEADAAGVGAGDGEGDGVFEGSGDTEATDCVPGEAAEAAAGEAGDGDSGVIGEAAPNRARGKRGTRAGAERVQCRRTSRLPIPLRYLSVCSDVLRGRGQKHKSTRSLVTTTVSYVRWLKL